MPGKQGYDVTLAEAGTALGGRVQREARLPGLAAWMRVDCPKGQLDRLPKVGLYFDSRLTADDVLGFGIPRIAIATGAHWRADGVGHLHTRPIPIDAGAVVFTPGCETTYITPASEVSTWTRATMEQHFIQKRLIEKGVTIRPFTALDAIGRGEVHLSCTFTGRAERLACDAVVLVTARLPEEALALELKARRAEWADAGIESVSVIVDALAPATIAHATYAGRRYAEELDAPPRDDDAVPFRREIAELLPLDKEGQG